LHGFSPLDEKMRITIGYFISNICSNGFKFKQQPSSIGKYLLWLQTGPKRPYLHKAYNPEVNT